MKIDKSLTLMLLLSLGCTNALADTPTCRLDQQLSTVVSNVANLAINEFTDNWIRYGNMDCRQNIPNRHTYVWPKSELSDYLEVAY